MSGLTIGDLSTRTGLAVSAIRFYETHGIVHPVRNKGGHRRYGKHDLRRLSFAMIAQKLGLPLADIAANMKDLPIHKAPSRADWTGISKAMRVDLDDRIAQLQRLRDNLDGCIGCGCLSLDTCALYNPADTLGSVGSGPQILIGNTQTND